MALVLAILLSGCEIEEVAGFISSAPWLDFDTWKITELSSLKHELVFKFKAESAAAYLHIECIELEGAVSVEILNGQGGVIATHSLTVERGGAIRLRAPTLSKYRIYGIRLWSDTARGSFRLGVNSLLLPPGTVSGLTSLDNGAFPSGTLSSGARWYRFTAPQGAAWLHLRFDGTPRRLEFQLYTEIGEKSGEPFQLPPPGDTAAAGETLNHRLSLVDGNLYHIKVTGDASGGTASFRIGVGGSLIPPDALDAPLLPSTAWRDCTFSDGREQWFRLTADSSGGGWLHAAFVPDGADRLGFRLFAATGSSDYPEKFVHRSDSNKSIRYTELSPNAGYWVRVRPGNASVDGAFRLAAGGSAGPPDPGRDGPKD